MERLKELMMVYGISIPQRCTRKQKQFFFEYVAQICKEHKMPFSFQSKHGKLTHVTNMVIGDLDNAKTIVACAYETPAKSILPSKYYPFHPSQNIKEEVKEAVCKAVITVLLAVLMYFILRNFATSSALWKVLRVIASLVLVLIVFVIGKGTPNPINMNRNSAAVAVLMWLTENVTYERIAYVLLGENINSHEGLKLLQENIGDKKEVILLDCIAKGEQVIVAYREGRDVSSLLHETFTAREYKDPKNALAYFPKSIEITSGEVENRLFVVKNTRNAKDSEVDMNQLFHIASSLKQYIERGREQ
ncbi:MAG: hypothetical protein HUJ58_03165 [Erysipelotrichaceae bacterium]|nr:hypothetical protein [Erysipelotrichaceae bacterium]